MNDWTDTGSYAYNKLQSENEDLKRLVESQCYDLDAMSAIKEERDQLQEQNTMLDRIAAEYEETVSHQAKRIAADEALLRQALEIVEMMGMPAPFSFHPPEIAHWQHTVAALRERLKA